MIRAPSFLVAWPSGELEPIFPGNRVYRISPIHAYFNYGSITHASWFGGTAYPSDPYRYTGSDNHNANLRTVSTVRTQNRQPQHAPPPREVSRLAFCIDSTFNEDSFSDEFWNFLCFHYTHLSHRHRT